MSQQLPYVFDLLYDIKTLDELNDHLSGKQRCATSASDFELYELARNNGVDCDGLAERGKRDLPDYYGICDKHLESSHGYKCPICRASHYEALLVLLTRTDAGLMPDLVETIKRTLKENGYGNH
jgi:hypothetical protein